MKNGFIKTAAVTPKIRVADPKYNGQAVISGIKEATMHGAKIIVLPELVLTGYTCNDLFLQSTLIKGAEKALLRVVDSTKGNEALIFVGLPMVHDGKLYNVAAAVWNGQILGVVPKKYLPNYGEFYEARYFTPGTEKIEMADIAGRNVPFGINQLFSIDSVSGLMVGCEICEDLWVADPPSTHHAMAGATVIVNLSASDETVGKASYREMLVSATSARLMAGYIYCSAGEGESTQDLVFGGHDMIAENGVMLTKSRRISHGTIYGDIDIERINMERRRSNTFVIDRPDSYRIISVNMRVTETRLERFFDPYPFVPSIKEKRHERCEEIFNIQTLGLKKRLEHTGAKTVVIGVSGGLDSTLAVLVAVRAFDELSLSRRGIMAVTMPCFGTTSRTKNNAVVLSERLRLNLKEIDITTSVKRHFEDIGHDIENRDVTYENGQARERTQVLMDLANKYQGLVIGTGDMSELALGWATYNGDHMSMYGVNCGVPKTLVRHLVSYYADETEDAKLRDVLRDILDTPVSPELLPPTGDDISQKTEDLVGPYELHDFFLYNMLRAGSSPDKIYRMAVMAFDGVYDGDTILKWEKIFYRRFFAQQFKRSCLPDGPKVGSVAVSPRGDLRMPSDAMADCWMNILEKI